MKALTMSLTHDVETRQSFSQEQEEWLPGIFVGSVEAPTMSSARNTESRAKNVRALPEPNLDRHAMRTLS